MTRHGLAALGVAISLAGAASPAQGQLDRCTLVKQRDGAFAGECVRGDGVRARLRVKAPTDPQGSEWPGAVVFGDGYPMPAVLALQGSRGALRLEQPWLAVTEIRRATDTLSFMLNANAFVEGVGTVEDVRILRRVLAMWPDSTAWARGPGTDCPPGATARSLWCALRDASLAEIGEFQSFRPAMQEVRWSVFHLWKRSYIEHPLQDPNAAPETTFAQIRQLVVDALTRIEKDLRGEPNPRVEPIIPRPAGPETVSESGLTRPGPAPPAGIDHHLTTGPSAACEALNPPRHGAHA